MTQGYQLDHVLSLRFLKPFFDNVLFEHGGPPHVCPLAVHSTEQVERVILSLFLLFEFLGPLGPLVAALVFRGWIL